MLADSGPVQTIGLIGGMSWESSAVYYRLLNNGVEQRLGGLSSASTVMVEGSNRPSRRDHAFQRRPNQPLSILIRTELAF